MEIKNISVIACLVLLAGCQQAEVIDKTSEKFPMSIKASIGELQKSRYISSDETPNSLSFKENDEIGLFVHDRDVVKWTCLGEDAWKPEKTTNWPNREDEYWFYAYYPYVTAMSKESVRMPSLAAQKGTIENLSDCDFLVASTKQSFGDNGVVSFTGDAAFKHVSSLVAITIKGNGDLKASTIQKISFSAKDIASGTTYSFTTGNTSLVENEIFDTMESDDLDYTMKGVDKTFYFILNKDRALADITFCMEYSTGEKKYKAEKQGLGLGTLVGGNRYNFNLNISDGVLTISGGNIQDWGNGSQLEDIIINGVEQKELENEDA